LEESARFAQYDLTKTVDDPVNVPITSQPIDVYLCPSMNMPRTVPEPTVVDEKLGPASYMISSRTDYGLYQTLDGAFANPADDGHYSLDFKNITDGTSKTLLIGETNYGHIKWLWTGTPGLNGTPMYGDQTWAHGYWALSWGHMANTYPQLYNNTSVYLSPHSKRVFRSDHSGGVYFVMLDASVQFLTNETDPAVRRALVTRAGDESVAGIH
jgi:hypothetical protein